MGRGKRGPSAVRFHAAGGVTGPRRLDLSSRTGGHPLLPGSGRPARWAERTPQAVKTRKKAGDYQARRGIECNQTGGLRRTQADMGGRV